MRLWRGSIDKSTTKVKELFSGALMRAERQELKAEAKIFFWFHFKSSESRRQRSSTTVVGWT